MEHPDHTDEGCAGYMMMQVSYALYSTTKWKDPADVGNYFNVPTTAITDTDQKYEERNGNQGRTYYTPSAIYAPPSGSFLSNTLIQNTIQWK